MQRPSIIASSSERHDDFKAVNSFGEIMIRNGLRLSQEPQAALDMLKAKEAKIMSGRVTKWAKRSNIINQTGGVSTAVSDMQLRQVYEINPTISGKSAELQAELSGLRDFSPDGNEDYQNKLPEVDESSQVELTTQDAMAIEARKIINQISCNSLSAGELTNLMDNQFILTA